MASDRHIRVSIYLTPSEQKQLAENFKIDLPISGQSKLKLFATYMRNAGLGKKVQYKKTAPIAQEQYAELARLASNLNQMMHSVHTGNFPETEQAQALVKAIRDKLININNKDESKS